MSGQQKRTRARQVRWVLPTIALVIVSVGIGLAAFYGLSQQKLTGDFGEAQRSIARTEDLLDSALKGFVLGLAVLLAAVAVWRFKVTTRIVRPVETLNEALLRLARGDLAVQVQLATTDEFREVGDSLNQLTQYFRKTIGSLRSSVDDLVAAGIEIADEPHEADANRDMQDLAGQVRTRLDFFKIGPPEVLLEDSRWSLLEVHKKPRQRQRQVRWVASHMATLFLAATAVWLIFHGVAKEEVQENIFSAHKKIESTSQMLDGGLAAGMVGLAVTMLAVTLWRVRATARIIRPVDALHEALSHLNEGKLGVRVELKETDEFQEIGQSLNDLVERFSDTLVTVRLMVNRLVSIGESEVDQASEHAARDRMQSISVQISEQLAFFQNEPLIWIRE